MTAMRPVAALGYVTVVAVGAEVGRFGSTGWLGGAAFVFAFLVTLLLTLLIVPPSSRERRRVPPTKRQRTTSSPRQSGRATGDVVMSIPADDSFMGRRDELRALTAQLLGSGPSSDRDEPEPGHGPALALIHGMPGVGKAALARQLARQVASEFPDGLLYADLREGAETARSSATVLADFIEQLGWQGDLPARTSARAKLFRTLSAGKRVLVVLVSADQRQAAELLPTDATCAAVVASRRDLSGVLGAPSLQLDVLQTDDAIDMLYAVAMVNPDDQEPECAARVVDACGNLPLAIQSAGERISLQRSTLCNVEGLLRSGATRLKRLERQGRAFEEGFEAEYRALAATERRAFWLLSLTHSVTFRPWVLCPLLEVGQAEAERITERLAQAQLVVLADRDLPLEQAARYRLHPLVRLYAQERIAAERLGAEAEAARARLVTVHDQIIRTVVAELRGVDPVAHGDRDAPALANHDDIVEGIVANVSEWLRNDYLNITEAIERFFDRREDSLCWQVGEMLGGVVPDGADMDVLLRALDRAEEAAHRDGSVLGAVDVQIAKAATLNAVEYYPMSEELLDKTEELLRKGIAGVDRPEIELRRAMVHLRRGEALVQLRQPARADAEFTEAATIFRTLDRTAELQLIDIQIALCFDTNLVLDAYERFARSVGLANEFWVALQRFEELRRSGAWAEAESFLDKALALSFGDARRRANVLYRRARLSLDQRDAMQDGRSDAGPAANGRWLGIRGVRRATEATVVFRQMSNAVGAIRAAQLLVRALVTADRPDDARRVLSDAQRDLEALGTASAGDAYLPLQARLHQAKAEQLHAKAMSVPAGAGRQALLAEAEAEADNAISDFAAADDGRSQDKIRKMLSSWKNEGAR